MCFSVNVNIVKEELEKRYGATFLDHEKYNPSYYYHAFGLPEMPAVCSGKPKEIQILTWGLIPAWVKSKESANEIRFKTFNARSESIDTKPSFALSFSTKRCIIPVNGYFEWQHVGAKKIPWYIRRADDEIISFAGLWNEWAESSTGELFSTFTIVTTEANELMAGIHNSAKRMPVILDRQGEKQWIDTAIDKREALELLKPCRSDILNAYTIGPLINDKTANRNSAGIIEPHFWNTTQSLF
jgi:putative SOS response-associated peptidase YedK